MSTSSRFQKVSIPGLRWIAVVAAIAGTVALAIGVTQTGVPEVQRISDINALMNMGYVKVTAQVLDVPRYDARTDYLTFTVADGSGELRVRSYQTETRDLLNQQRIPKPGDQITLEGTLTYRVDSVSLSLASVDTLEVRSPQPETVTIATIAIQEQAVPIQVSGTVRQIREPYPGLTILSLRDSSGEIDVTWSEATQTLYGGVLPSVGDTINVVGIASDFRGKPQLTATKFQSAPLQSADKIVSLQTLATHTDGSWITVQGILGEPQPFSAGMKYPIRDETGRSTLLLWTNIVESVSEEVLQAGQVVKVSGVLQRYQDHVEILPELPMDVVASEAVVNIGADVEMAAPEVAIPVTSNRAIAEVQNQIGQYVDIAGELVDAHSYAGGFKLTLADATGQMEVVVREEIFAEFERVDDLHLGAKLQVNGKVDTWDDQPQLIVFAPDQVQIGEATSINLNAVEIKSLDLSQLNTLVKITGTVQENVEFSAGTRLVLSDGSGTIDVIIWQNLQPYIDAKLLKTGTAIAVIGHVGEFNANLQLVPPLPHFIATSD